jgi:hypothetical protein
MSAAVIPFTRSRDLPPDKGDARDEMNLAEFPITLLTEHGPRHLKTLEFEDIIQDPRTNQPVTRKVTITGSDKYGLPSARDDDVILGLILLTKYANNFTDRIVHFTRYELLRLLDWRDEGKSYHRLEESINRWMTVTLFYDRAWWDNERKSWVDAKFHILEDAFLYERERIPRKLAGQTALPFSSFTWSNIVFQSFQAGYLRRLSLDFYLDLETPTSKRLFRFLDKHFYHRPRLEFDLEDLAFAHIGLSRGYHTGKIKEKLTPGIEELEAKGFLEPLPPSERFLQVHRGRWKVIFLKKLSSTAGKPPEAALTALAQQLTARGVTPSTAAELVAAYPAERIEAKMDLFDWRMENSDKQASQNPAGYLVQSIRDDYTPPKSYVPKDERERQKQAAAKARHEADEKRRRREAAQQQQEATEAAARQAKQDHIDQYLAGLSSKEREELERQAFSHATIFHRENLHRTGPIGDAVRRTLIYDEVLRRHPFPEPHAAG